MATVNYWNGQIWIDAGLTWNYYFSPTDARYNDLWIAPDPASNASGDVEILRKWSVASPQEIEFWITVRNNDAVNPVYFAWNFVDISP
jgi:hypothetical protein